MSLRPPKGAAKFLPDVLVSRKFLIHRDDNNLAGHRLFSVSLPMIRV
jgi:hypothetical protein